MGFKLEVDFFFFKDVTDRIKSHPEGYKVRETARLVGQVLPKISNGAGYQGRCGPLERMPHLHRHRL